MSLENDLDELEKMLGFAPIAGIEHPNPDRRYPSAFSDSVSSFKEKVKSFFGKLKGWFKKKEVRQWG